MGTLPKRQGTADSTLRKTCCFLGHIRQGLSYLIDMAALFTTDFCLQEYFSNFFH